LVYMRYAAIQALPAIANAFYTKALKCWDRLSLCFTSAYSVYRFVTASLVN
jgi:hypothetical protein